MARKPAASTRPKAARLEELLQDVNPQRATQERKFQAILDAYNARNENKEEGLSGVKFYVFRTFPRIDNRLSGRQRSNIETFECVKQATDGGEMVEVTELPADIRTYVTTRHGGGRYRVSLNDKGREQEQVVQTALKVDDIEFPAILDPKELVASDPETMGWITRQVALGLLAKLPDGGFGMPNSQTRAGSSATTEPAGMADVAMEALRQARQPDPLSEHAGKKVIDMMADAAERMHPAPPDPVAQVTAIATALKGNGDGGAVTAMCGLLSTVIVENNKMLMLMMTQRNPAPRADRGDDDSVDKTERILEMLGKYGGPKPAGGGLMDIVKEWAPLILPLLLMGKMPPAAAVAAVQSAAAMRGAGAAPGGETETAAGGAAGQLTMQQAEEFATRAMSAMQRGHTGDDFALSLEVIFNPQTYDMIRQLGKDNIIAFLLQSRNGQFFATNGPHTTAFIEAFLSYGEPDEAPPAAATPAASGTPPAPPPGPVAVPATAAPLGAV